MIPTFEKITRGFIVKAPHWFQDQPVTVKRDNLDFFKTVDEINIYKFRHQNPEVNIFILYFFYEPTKTFVYFLSMEAEDEETGESCYPVYFIGSDDREIANVDSITFEFFKEYDETTFKPKGD